MIVVLKVSVELFSFVSLPFDVETSKRFLLADQTTDTDILFGLFSVFAFFDAHERHLAHHLLAGLIILERSDLFEVMFKLIS